MSRVALIGENSCEYVDILLGIWNRGDCAVLLDWRIPLRTLLTMMKEAGVYECYIEQKFYSDEMQKGAPGIRFSIYTNHTLAAMFVPSAIYEKFMVSYSEDEAVVIYSSGTTGKSKGVILSHLAIQKNADAIIDYMRPSITDCIYIAKTMSHSSTLVGEVLVALKAHIPLVVAPTIVPPRYILNRIDQFNVSIICLNPTLLTMLAESYDSTKYSILSLKTIYVSGAVLNDRVYLMARNIFSNISIYNVYGLSEAGPRVSAQTINCCTGNSVGKPISGVEIVIVNEQGTLVEIGEYGCVHVHTPSKYQKYVVGSAKYDSLYKDWVNTGDIGYWDVHRELYIVGRIDDMIIIDSHKIYAEDIENRLMHLIPSIQECIVKEETHNDKSLLICEYVGNHFDSMQARRELLECLMPYEVPKMFIKKDYLPKTPSGKIIRR